MLRVPFVLTLALISASLLGTRMDIPGFEVSRYVPAVVVSDQYGIPWTIPGFQESVLLSVNFPGSILPVLLSAVLIARGPLRSAAVAVGFASLVAYVTSETTSAGVIMVNVFAVCAASAFAAMLLAPHRAGAIAYVAGVFGILAGADLARLPQAIAASPGALSIGGGGFSDAIFIIGAAACALTIATQFIPRWHGFRFSSTGVSIQRKRASHIAATL